MDMDTHTDADANIDTDTNTNSLWLIANILISILIQGIRHSYFTLYSYYNRRDGPTISSHATEIYRHGKSRFNIRQPKINRSIASNLNTIKIIVQIVCSGYWIGLRSLDV